MQITYMVMQCRSFFQQVDSNGQILKTLINKCSSNSSADFALEFDIEYQKELCKLHNDYPLAPDKIEIKKEMLSKYQLMISNF